MATPADRPPLCLVQGPRKRPFFWPRQADNWIMLNRLPSDPGSFRDLLSDLGLKSSDAPRIARALDVSESTIWRWMRDGAPKTACLSLWWLSHHGHSEW